MKQANLNASNIHRPNRRTVGGPLQTWQQLLWTTATKVSWKQSYEGFSVFSCRPNRADLVVSIGVLVVLVVVVLEPLPLFSEQSLFWLFRLSEDFSLWGTTSFRALYPLGPFALRGPLPLGAICPQGSFTFWVIQMFGDFWVLFLLPAAGTEGSSVLL